MRAYKQVVIVCSNCKTANDVAWMGIGVTGMLLLRAECSECKAKVEGETDPDDLLKLFWESEAGTDEQPPASPTDTVH